MTAAKPDHEFVPHPHPNDQGGCNYQRLVITPSYGDERNRFERCGLPRSAHPVARIASHPWTPAVPGSEVGFCQHWMVPGVTCGEEFSRHASVISAAEVDDPNDHVPCSICEEAAKVCVSRMLRWRTDGFNLMGSRQSDYEREAGECAVSIRAACRHITPPRSELADQLEALGKAATPGTWVRHGSHAIKAEDRGGMRVGMFPNIGQCYRPDDANLAVALVNALPEILTALRRT